MRLYAIRLILPTALSMLILFSAYSSESSLELSDEVAGVVEPIAAPEWDVLEWINSNPGSVGSNHGRVIVIDFFQLWCPGCNTFTGPLMEKWQQRFSEEIDSGDLLLVKIHTVFEGHDYQNTSRLKEYLV